MHAEVEATLSDLTVIAFRVSGCPSVKFSASPQYCRGPSEILSVSAIPLSPADRGWLRRVPWSYENQGRKRTRGKSPAIVTTISAASAQLRPHEIGVRQTRVLYS